MNSQFKIISTFSGCGGSSLGYKLAGGEVVLAVEWDDNAAETYRLNFPNTDLYHGDITDLSVDECLQRTGLKPSELDILDGSPPCQGFSTSGKRKFDDDRNQLFKEYCRLLKGLQPKVFVMENVSGLVKGKMKLIFTEILKELKACGYKVKCRKMNMSYYGVAQARQRVIFIGTRNDLGLEPSHPAPQMRPIPSKEVIGNVVNSPEELAWAEGRIKSKQERYFARKVKPGQNASKYHPKGHWFNFSKLHPNKPAPTILKMVRGAILHYNEDRTLTISEIKRLSSFPDEFIFTGSFEEKWGRIGNTVPPEFMRAIAVHIFEHILAEGLKKDNA